VLLFGIIRELLYFRTYGACNRVLREVGSDLLMLGYTTTTTAAAAATTTTTATTNQYSCYPEDIGGLHGSFFSIQHFEQPPLFSNLASTDLSY